MSRPFLCPTRAKRLAAVLNHFLQFAFADHGAAAHFGTAEPPLSEPCVNGVRRDATQVGRRFFDRKEPVFAHKSTSHPVIAEINLDITVRACNSQSMQSHYAITSRVCYYMASARNTPFDFKRWKDA